MRTPTLCSIAAWGLTITLATAAVAAHVEGFADAQKLNAAKLREYTWKSRTEIQKKGETKAVQLMLVRYDTRGQLQNTMVSSTAQQTPQRGLRGHIADRKKEELLQTLEELKALMASYRDLSSPDVQRLMSAAGPGKGQDQRLIRATGTNVLQQGDSVTVWGDASTLTLRKAEIVARLDQNVVRGTFEFQDLPDGPNAMVRAVIQYPNEELMLTMENFEYTKVVGSK